MSRTLQFKRYANTALANVVGAPGEMIIDYTNYFLTIHDGLTPGGHVISSFGIDPTVRNFANTINVFTQSAYNQANIAIADTITLQNTFITANAIINVLFGIESTQNNNINLAINIAQSAFYQAGVANSLSQAAFLQIAAQNAQNTNYILQLSDTGKYIYYTQSSNVFLYIPTSSNVAFSNGTTIKIVSQNTAPSANITVFPNTGVSLYNAGNTISGSHNVTPYGVATLMMAKANTWFISGFGIN